MEKMDYSSFASMDVDNLEELCELLEEKEGITSHKEEIEIQGKEGSSYVKVSKDFKEAWLYLSRPTNDNRYTKEDVIAFLEQNNVKAGYIMSNIIGMVKKGVYERPIRVAREVPVKEGRNGYYEFNFDTNVFEKKTPDIREDGSVDYSSLNLLVGIKEGDWVAKYHKSVPGESGQLVDGSFVIPAPVKELAPLKGKGFYYDKEQKLYIAKISGKVDLVAPDEIQIRDVYEIDGDVNQLNPFVNFYGDIEIKGNVESGTVIHAGRNVTINGTVEACEIIAGGDVVLKRGIQGGNRARVIANGTVYADFIEHTFVKTGKDVNSNTILNCEIYSNGIVSALGRKGSIVGGNTDARQGVLASNIGNPVEVKTVIHVGLRQEDYERNRCFMALEEELRGDLLKTVKDLTYLLKQKKLRELSDTEKGQIVTLNTRKNSLLNELTKNQEEGDKISTIMKEASTANIHVKGMIYKGSIILMNAQSYPLREENSRCSFRSSSGIIEQVAYFGP